MPADESEPIEPQFTVPVPAYSTPTQSIPVPPPPPPPGQWMAELEPDDPYAANALARQGPSDAESLRNLTLVLLGVVMGFWLMVGIRILAHLVESGPTDRLLIETIDTTSAETVIAALVAILAVASALASRIVSGLRAGGPLLWSTVALTVATLATAVWRLV
ncbi:MAG TPA: hypothetical protein VFT81_05825 [Dermatophilaceae bacterium]|nr:hypothetical protein [Dermatophilaceae bacterium]